MDPVQIIVICQSCKTENLLTIVGEGIQTPKCSNCNTILLQYSPVSGYIYVLSNPKMPNLLKIGFTKRPIEERVEELSSTTGVPAKFFLEAYFLSTNPEDDERKIHQQLNEYRVESREFFEVELAKTLEVIESVCERPPYYLNPQHRLLGNLQTKTTGYITEDEEGICEVEENTEKLRKWQEKMWNR